MFSFIVTSADPQMTSYSPTSTCFHSPAQGPLQSSTSVGVLLAIKSNKPLSAINMRCQEGLEPFCERFVGWGGGCPDNSSRMREAVAACCGIRYLQSHLWHAGQEVAWHLKKKIPLLQRKRYTRLKHARNSIAFMQTKVKWSLIYDTLKLQKRKKNWLVMFSTGASKVKNLTQ